MGGHTTPTFTASDQPYRAGIGSSGYENSLHLNPDSAGVQCDDMKTLRSIDMNAQSHNDMQQPSIHSG